MSHLKYKLILLIFSTLGFQQVFVINIGGSLKIYELASLFLLFIALYTPSSWVISSRESLFLFVFMVVSPIISTLLFYASGHDIGQYFSMFPEANTLRYSQYFSPFIALLYSVICWVTFNEIVRSKRLYENIIHASRLIVAFATFIALYSIYASIFSGLFGWVDPISHLPDLVQRKGSQVDFGVRSTGFSQEPSFYIFFQSWVILILYGIRNSYQKILFYILLLVNLAALILTFSTSIFALVIAVFLGSLAFSTAKRRVKLSAALVVLMVIVANLIDFLDANLLFDYYFKNKILNFFSPPVHTLDSGSFRAYTSALGVEIFKDYPLFGVGVGVSNYFMPIYESHISLDIIGIELGVGEVPQSAYARVLAEQGLMGFLSLLLFLSSVVKRLYRSTKSDDFSKIFFIGIIFTALILLSIQPQYSLFIWAFMGLGVNYVAHKQSVPSLMNKRISFGVAG